MKKIDIIKRDLTEASMNLFKHIVEVGAHWSGNPPTYEVFPSPGSTVRKDKGNLTDLKKWELLTTQGDADIKDAHWIYLTPLGEQLKASLEADEAKALLGNGVEPEAVVVDDRKTTPKKTASTPKKATPAAKKAAPAEKPAPKPKIDRAKVRYEAIQECMAATKADTWRKTSYVPMLKHLQTTYPDLFHFGRNTTKEKQHKYATGIVDFCLAACRKLASGKPANA